jgi:hypothetical protein
MKNGTFTRKFEARGRSGRGSLTKHPDCGVSCPYSAAAETVRMSFIRIPHHFLKIFTGAKVSKIIIRMMLFIVFVFYILLIRFLYA